MATDDALTVGLREFFTARGLDPCAPNLIDTPRRVAAALREMTVGYDQDPAEFLARTFADVERSDDMIVLTGIAFASTCEHHLLPFTGTAAVGYIPGVGAPVVGLSKLARVVDVFARRLQTQERMTHQVTDALDTHLVTQGAACVVKATHTCMTVRGVAKAGAEMVTSSLTGAFLHQPDTRAEFMALIT